MRPSRAFPFLLLASCYTYRPIATPAPAPGSAIDVQLNDAGARDLATEVGPGVEHIRGRVLAADSTALDLSVAEVQDVRGEPTVWNGERLRLPQRYVRSIERRRLSLGGTGLLGGAVAAGLVAAVGIAGRQGSGVPSGGGPGGQGH
jgi:hypothetical protein